LREREETADIIEGRNPVLELLRSGRPVNRVLLAENIRDREAVGEIMRLARGRGVPVEWVARRLLDRESVTHAHQGVIAYTAVKEYASLDELLALPARKAESPLYVVLDGIEDPQNLGSILRTAAASGVHGVIIRSRRAVGLTAAVARASAGVVWHMAVARVANIPQAVQSLKERGVWVVGIDMKGGASYQEIDFKPPSAIVVGSEGQGLSELVRKRCDATAYIPMRGEVSSLNASVAAALVMYEAFRQRSS
jgi:23S rRNA (guanosine2251-2'-O)-methyltransferase